MEVKNLRARSTNRHKYIASLKIKRMVTSICNKCYNEIVLLLTITIINTKKYLISFFIEKDYRMPFCLRKTILAMLAIFHVRTIHFVLRKLQH